MTTFISHSFEGFARELAQIELPIKAHEGLEFEQAVIRHARWIVGLRDGVPRSRITIRQPMPD